MKRLVLLLALGCASPPDGSNVGAASGGAAGGGGKAGAPAAGATSTAGLAGTGGVVPQGGAASSGGTTPQGGTAGTGGEPPQGGAPAGLVPALMGVGYGGIRIVSRDGGMTWGSRAHFSEQAADDSNLLRTVAYGNGLWFAVGQRFVTSTDGVIWSEPRVLNEVAKHCVGTEAVAFTGGYFYMVCGAWLGRSPDAVSWSDYATLSDEVQSAIGGHTWLAHRAGKFGLYGDTGASFESTDAQVWTPLPGVVFATYCVDAFKSEQDCHQASWFGGVYLRSIWGGGIERSNDGVEFEQVYADDLQLSLYRSSAISEGFAAP
jgi:hypothetical protein